MEGKPEHMLKDKTAGERVPAPKQHARVPEKRAAAAKGKKNVERSGDWTCQKCLNLNYSFRSVCNRCNLTHKESQELQSKRQTSVFTS